MADILVYPWPLASHAMATLKIAKTLRSAGHTVVYVSIGVETAIVRDNGFVQEVILADEAPGGMRFSNRSQRQTERFFRENLPRIVNRLERAFDGMVAKYKFELALVDRNHVFSALPLYGRGVKPVMIWATLPADRRPGIPPLTSAILPTRTVLGRLRVNLEWVLTSANAWKSIRAMGLSPIVKDLARRNDFPRERLTRGPLGWELQIPEVVACAECFDVSPAAHPMRHYLGPCIDFERREPDFDWALLTPGRKLAYCALGTSGHVYPGALAFLGRVVEALRGLEGWDVVLAAGDFYQDVAETIARASVPHIVVVRDAPQLALLKRADVMLTHGGLGSIKECVHFGVPMVVFPGFSDQLGNGARVAHHQLGAVGDLGRSSAADIRALVTQVTSSPAIRANLTRMQQAFAASDQDEAIRALVDQLLDSRSPSAPASLRAWLSAPTGA